MLLNILLYLNLMYLITYILTYIYFSLVGIYKFLSNSQNWLFLYATVNSIIDIQRNIFFIFLLGLNFFTIIGIIFSSLMLIDFIILPRTYYLPIYN